MRVLLVDDNAMNRCVVVAMLKTADVETHEAADGESSLAMLDAGQYDMVLMDLRMPGMDGMTAIAHIRARQDDKARVPIIVVTADSGTDMCESCLAGGADDVLMKPVNLNALFDAIGRLMVKTAPQNAAIG